MAEMKRHFRTRRPVAGGVLRGALVLLALTGAAGCRRDVARIEAAERADPALQSAWAAAEQGDLEQARQAYEAILAKHPDLARAHLDLAMVLENAGGPPLQAIYHLMRYQELRPDSEKTEMLTRRIRQLAAQVGGTRAALNRAEAAERRLEALQEENARLRMELAALRGGGLMDLPATGEWRLAAADSLAARPAPTGRVYRVQANDNLTRIAEKMYGDGSLGGKIYEANRNQLRSMNSIRTGQVLVIPP